MKEPKKILVVRTDRLGDVILSTPVIKNLRLAYPSSFIAFMCRPYTKDVLLGNPYLDEVIIYDKYGRHRSVASSLRFALSLSKKKFDLALILHPTNRVHMITFFARIPMRVGWDRKMGILLTHRLSHTKQNGIKHEMEYTLDILHLAGIPVVEHALFFPVQEEAKKKVAALLREKGLNDNDKFFVIHPSASCPSKRWPISYFGKLVDMIKDTFDKPILIISSKEERRFCDELFEGRSYLVDLRGELNIGQLGALMEKVEVLVSNDSGPVHIAAALGRPVISIFGRSDPGLSPRRWRPLGKNSFFFHKDVGCTVCLAHNCDKGFLCLKAIKPEDIFELIKKILSK